MKNFGSKIHIGDKTFDSMDEMKEYGRKNNPSWYIKSCNDVVVNEYGTFVDGKKVNDTFSGKKD